MLKNFDSPDIYMLAGFYFIHSHDLYTGIFCIALAIFDAYALKELDKALPPRGDV